MFIVARAVGGQGAWTSDMCMKRSSKMKNKESCFACGLDSRMSAELDQVFAIRLKLVVPKEETWFLGILGRFH